MMTRYASLRASIAYFAATAESQLVHDLGSDDAVNETPYPLEDMLFYGEITSTEVDIIRPLEELIAEFCSKNGVKPWHDEALLASDPRWAKIRCLAADILKQLPEEKRESDFQAQLP
jgi:hypothetical protein